MKTVTVCSSCMRASCWHGEFLCDSARGAGTAEKTVADLKKLGLEHHSYWNIDPATGVAFRNQK
jgi:hypothetical protein